MADIPLKILMMSAEMVPFAKTGGLADVVGTLPKALRAAGCEVRVIIPRYGRIDLERFDLKPVLEPYQILIDNIDAQVNLLSTTISATDCEVPVYLVDNQHYFERDGLYMYEDDADRFIFFCRASLEGMRLLDWKPDVIHCHDWHTAIIPNWLKTLYRRDPFYMNTASVYTIHNLAYQGIFGYRVLEIAGVDEYGFLAHPDLPHLSGAIDFMGRGIHYADIITTVSESYAREILHPERGEGLDPLLQQRQNDLFGVLNGIDTSANDPAIDTYIAAHYDLHDTSGKQQCKADLQREMQLPQRSEQAVLGLISRLTDSKGFDLINSLIETLLENHPIQLVILGTGELRYHERLATLRARFPQQIAFTPTFNKRLAHKIYAGSDMFLMPSRYEPCGLGQLLAMRYGSIPIVRATGGLADTVCDYNPLTGQGNGFVFHTYNAYELYGTIMRALEYYRDPLEWAKLMKQAMAEDFGWERPAQRYMELYQLAIQRKQERG